MGSSNKLVGVISVSENKSFLPYQRLLEAMKPCPPDGSIIIVGPAGERNDKKIKTNQQTNDGCQGKKQTLST